MVAGGRFERSQGLGLSVRGCSLRCGIQGFKIRCLGVEGFGFPVWALGLNGLVLAAIWAVLQIGGSLVGPPKQYGNLDRFEVTLPAKP